MGNLTLDGSQHASKLTALAMAGQGKQWSLRVVPHQ